MMCYLSLKYLYSNPPTSQVILKLDYQTVFSFCKSCPNSLELTFNLKSKYRIFTLGDIVKIFGKTFLLEIAKNTVFKKIKW